MLLRPSPAANVETDSLDREIFNELLESSRELSDLMDRGSNLLPDFKFLLQDIFATFFKYNIILFPPEEVKRSSRLGRKLIEKAIVSELYNELREETVLDKFNSALATVTMAGSMLEWIKSDEGLSDKKLIKQWEIDEAEERYEELAMENETWKEVEENEDIDDSLDESFEKGKKENEMTLSRQQEELEELEEAQDKRLDNIDIKLDKLVDSSMRKAEERINDAEKELMQWGAAIGSSESDKPVGEKLDLAESLSKNEKLKRISLMLGALNQEMFNARRKVWSKRGSEVYGISYGSELGYIIPSELVTLRHPVLRKDFLKRYVEQRLLRYYLKDETGRGPVIVCLDCSSSMAGDKELWSKALCLSIHELAKRQKRKFSVVVFSSSEYDLRVFSSSVGAGKTLTEPQLLELADYFPGGGTDFELPLQKALYLLSEEVYGRSDVLFITDGECDVTEPWLEHFLTEKSRLDFQVFSVLIDLNKTETPRTLMKFSDKVTTISQLQSKDARDIFLSF